MLERNVIRFNACIKPIYNHFEAPLQDIFTGEGMLASKEGSIIGTFTLCTSSLSITNGSGAIAREPSGGVPPSAGEG